MEQHLDTDKLFVYGTLLSAINNPMSEFLKKNSHRIGNAFFWGKLFDLGNYPGAIYNRFDLPNPSRVYGDVLQLPNPSEIFEYLDKYEEVGPDFPEPQEYIRKIIPVFLLEPNGSPHPDPIDCWAYLYNYNHFALGTYREKFIKHIPHGDYEKWLKNK